MNLEEIKKAIKDGKKVCWSNSLYEVIKSGKLLMVSKENNF